MSCGMEQRESETRVVIGIRSPWGCPCFRLRGRLNDDFGDELRLKELPDELRDVLSASEWVSIVDAMQAADGEVCGTLAAALSLVPVLGRALARALEACGLLAERRVLSLAKRQNERFEGRGLTFSRGHLALAAPPGGRQCEGNRYSPVAGRALPAVARRHACVLETVQCLVIDVDAGASKAPRVFSARSTDGGATLLGVARSGSARAPDDIYALIAGEKQYELVPVEQTLE